MIAFVFQTMKHERIKLCFIYECFQKSGENPRNGWCIMESPYFLMDDLGSFHPTILGTPYVSRVCCKVAGLAAGLLCKEASTPRFPGHSAVDIQGHCAVNLGGGNSNIFYFHPENWGRWTHFDYRIFFRWVETRDFFIGNIPFKYVHFSKYVHFKVQLQIHYFSCFSWLHDCIAPRAQSFFVSVTFSARFRNVRWILPTATKSWKNWMSPCLGTKRQVPVASLSEMCINFVSLKFAPLILSAFFSEASIHFAYQNTDGECMPQGKTSCRCLA